MNTITSIVVYILKIADGLMGYLQNQQLITAGKAEAVSEMLNSTISRISKAKTAKEAAETEYKKDGIDEDDPNLRD